MFVLSAPPEGVSEAEFHRWYDVHESEVLELDGFRSAERYRLAALRSSSGEPLPFTHLIAYEIEGDFDVAWGNLRAAVDGGRMQFPDWYPQLLSAGALGEALVGATKEAA
jgi:hypothetical protein